MNECPACGLAGGRYVTHVCMTAGIPSATPGTWTGVATPASEASAPLAALTKERDGLREQLDAAREALADLSEAVDAVCQSDVAGDAPTLEAAARSVLELALQRARAALGVVAAAETSGSALDQRAVESRGGGEAS